ncbi:TetR/AcrR family transcriptional regulator [Glutamicibacter sp. X7]
MANARTPRDEWIRAGLNALERGGPGAVRVESIASTLGVSKGGFYGYFSGRDQLLDEMLATWQHEAANAVITEVEAAAGDATARLAALHQSVDARADRTGLELAVREWGRRDPAVARRLAQVDAARMDYLRELFLEVTGDEEEALTRAATVLAVWMAGYLMRYDCAGRTHDEIKNLTMQRTLDR